MAELFGDLHGPQGFAVALGVGLAELAGDALFEGAALEVADDEDGLAVEAGHAGGHSSVVSELAVAVDLAEVGEQGGDVVHRMGALGMPGELGFEPGFRNGCGRNGLLLCDFCHSVRPL